jgi:mannose-1-phosphate guanylyltransferase/mannose-6-phosphate isomerase
MTNFVILCGGSGSRLWPKSREKLPKQFLKITNEYTMFQNTVLRIQHIILNNKHIFSNNKITIICNKEHSHIVDLQISEFNVKDIKYQIVCEPKGRDSAPAICIASLLGETTDNTFILPCDHVFDDREFSKCCIKAMNYVDNSIITFGIKPTRPETGYGYIKINNSTNDTIKFVEKPNYEMATQYVFEGTYLWNAGVFVFKNENMIECFKKYAPDIYESCYKTIEKSPFKGKELLFLLDENIFSNCRAISVDYAIMEKLCYNTENNTENTNSTINNSNQIMKKTILYDSKWSDIGSYTSLYDELDKNNDGNVINRNGNNNNVITLDTKNCYIETNEQSLIATIGIKDLIIVNTDDALLISNKDNSQDVKEIVNQLKHQKREEAVLHKTVFRPWGWYKNIEGNDYSGFKVKRIAVYPGKRLSLQSHNKRSEHWVIVKGIAKVQIGFEFSTLTKDQNIHIPINSLHRITNIGDELLEFTETQIGEYLGEDDIIRHEDDFGRV